MQFQPKIQDPEDIQRVLTSYKYGMSMGLIGRFLGCSAGAIKYILKKNNITIRSNKINSRKHFANFDYFNTIDTNDKAQILGLIAADGCISKNEIKISLAIEDSEYLETVKRKLSFTGDLYFRKRTEENHQDSKYLLINSDKMANDLALLGVIEKKSLILTFPTFKQVPELLIHSYILGYFEGDGGLSNWHKERVDVGVCGTIEFCEALKTLIKNKIDVNSEIYKRHKDRPTNSYQLMFGGNYQAFTFLEWIYKDCTFYMERKHQIYRWLKTRCEPRIEHGINKMGAIGENAARCLKLKAVQVLDIRERLEKGERGVDLAKEFNVCPTTISDIKYKKSWKSLTKETLHLYQKQS